MRSSSFPQVTAAVLATVLALAPHTVSSPTPAAPAPAATASATHLVLAGASLITSERLVPETPGCANMGVAGRLPGLPPGARMVSDQEPRYGGPKNQARSRMNNPLAMPQTLRPAMHMCVVDQFNPQDPSGARSTIYRL
jgi:hypothetical protein